MSVELEREFWKMKLQAMDEDAAGIITHSVRFQKAETHPMSGFTRAACPGPSSRARVPWPAITSA